MGTCFHSSFPVIMFFRGEKRVTFAVIIGLVKEIDFERMRGSLNKHYLNNGRKL